MKISVLLTTFNGAAFLDEQLQSIALQTQRPSELVVGDDGSTDGTLACLARFAADAPFPVRVHVNAQRLGYAANFLAGTQRTTGDLIAFCDQDDLWHPEKLAAQSAPFRDDRVMLSIGESRTVDRELRILPPPPRLALETGTFAPLTLDPFANPLGHNLVARSSLLRDLEFSARPRNWLEADGRLMAHDQWAYFLAGALGQVAVVGQELAIHRLHGGNACAGRGVDRASQAGWSSIADRRAFHRQRSAHLAQHCEERAAFLALASERLPAQWSDACLAAASRYRHFAAAFRERQTTMSDARIDLRVAAAARAWLISGTRPCWPQRSWPRHAARDGFFALIAG